VFIGDETISGSLNVSGSSTFGGGDTNFTDQDHDINIDVDHLTIKAQKAVLVSQSLDVQSTFTASLEEGYVWVGDSAGRTTTVATSSFDGGGSIDTGSLLVTASAAGATITFTKGDASTFDVTITSTAPDTSSLVTTSSFNDYTSSTDGRLTNIEATTASLDTSVTNLNVFTSSADGRLTNLEATTASLDTSVSNLNSYTSSTDSRLTNIELTTASLDTSVSNLNTFTSSQESFNTSATASISELLSFSSSLDTGYVTEAELAAATGALENQINTKLDSASFNSYTSSTDGRLNNIEATTASLDTSVSNLNSYTSSTDGRLTNIEATTASLDTSVSNLNTFTSSADGRLTNLEATTASLDTSVTNLNAFTSSQTNLNGTFATTGSNTFFGAETISGSVDISGSFKINSLNYPTASGVNGYFLQTNGTNQADWNYVRTMYEEVKNGGLTTLPKGTPVFATGSVGNQSIVVAADAGDPTRMPATYVLNESLAADAEGLGIIIGFINGVNTSAFNEGDVIYVGVGGGYTNVQPTGSALIQPLGIVNRVDASNGSGIVLNPGVANGLPNIPQGNAWVGNVDGVPTAVATSSFGGGGSTDISALNSFTASQEALNTTFATTGSNTFEGEQTINGTFTASLEEGYAWVGDSTGTTVAVATSSFGGGGSTDISALNSFTASQEVLNTTFATTASNTFTDNNTFEDGITVNQITAQSAGVDGPDITISPYTGGNLVVNGGGLVVAQNMVVTGSALISGSITITGSAYGNVNTLTVTSATASMDMSSANFFVLTLPTGSTTHLDATNVGLGQTVSLLVKQASTETGSLAFSPEFKFPTGSRYTATPTGSAEDIITFVTFNSTSEVFATSVKQLV
jgi:uncharacterized coiled-coil protein SlyX